MANSQNPLTHSVYFQLKDASAENVERLIQSCYELLTAIEGLISLHAGPRDEDLVRPVNDQQFHVGLVVVFESRAAHDVYQTHANHVEFIERNKENWESVRIFDASARVG